MSEQEDFIKWRLEELERNYQEVFHALYGGHKDEGGIEEELRDLTRKVNELRAVMMPDSLGHGGIHKRLKHVEDVLEGKQKSLEAYLKFWGPIVIAVISTGGLIVREWGPSIAARWTGNVTQYKNAEKHAERNKLKRPKKHIVKPVDDEQADETVSE